MPDPPKFTEVIMNISKIESYWDAYIYDKQENYTEDVDFLRDLIGKEPKKILEVACGAGRILAPLARDGHMVTGFDRDENMLSFIEEKLGDRQAEYYQADALNHDWGNGYDLVVEAANLMINIIAEGDYESAQSLFIRKAADALGQGGCLYLDFNYFIRPEDVYNSDSPRVIFEGFDDHGVYGRYSILSDTYSPATRMLHTETLKEFTLPDGSTHTVRGVSLKHIPTLEQVHGWLEATGLTTKQEFGDYQGGPITESTGRCIILARKG